MNVIWLIIILVGKLSVDGKICDVGGFNSFDNFFFDKKGWLWIGEDGDDICNMLWVYDLKMKVFKCFVVVFNGVEVMGLWISE